MRLFVSINFDGEVADYIYSIENELCRAAKLAFPTPKENLHMTLAFIGETDNIEGARRAIESTVFDRFDIYLSSIGKFPTSGGDLYFLGAEPSERLDALANEVRRRLSENYVSFDKKKFKPHITLARRVVCDENARPETARRRASVCRVSLMRSERVLSKMKYTELCGVNCRGV